MPCHVINIYFLKVEATIPRKELGIFGLIARYKLLIVPATNICRLHPEGLAYLSPVEVS
jgi:hypothetical protein